LDRNVVGRAGDACAADAAIPWGLSSSSSHEIRLRSYHQGLTAEQLLLSCGVLVLDDDFLLAHPKV